MFEAAESFETTLDGAFVSVKKGDLVRASHPLLKYFRSKFKVADGHVRFSVEQATAAPGELR